MLEEEVHVDRLILAPEREAGVGQGEHNCVFVNREKKKRSGILHKASHSGLKIPIPQSRTPRPGPSKLGTNIPTDHSPQCTCIPSPDARWTSFCSALARSTIPAPSPTTLPISPTQRTIPHHHNARQLPLAHPAPLAPSHRDPTAPHH